MDRHPVAALVQHLLAQVGVDVALGSSVARSHVGEYAKKTLIYEQISMSATSGRAVPGSRAVVNRLAGKGGLQAVSLGLLVGLASISAPPWAAATIIYGTGQGSSPSTSLSDKRFDPYWKVVALPVTLNNVDNNAIPLVPVITQPLPYAPVIVKDVCCGFVGGSTNSIQNGITTGGVTNYWISPNPNNITTSGIAPGDYNWIIAQTFNVSTAGNYNFSFQGAGDNQVSFYINGSIDQTDPQKPIITGGTQIGGTWNTFDALGSFTGAAFLPAGTNTAYMVLRDFGGETGVIIQQSSFQSDAAEVPAPVPLLGAAAAFGASRQLRRRIRLGRTAPRVEGS